jgi:NADPH-dependent 2,4-dienoyl-CoA reductase/sulfur reductase-like enzyme
MAKVIVVGAGPAGIAAASTLVAHGLRPTVIDEAAQAGGQVYRRPEPHIALDMSVVLGSEVRNYERFHATFRRLQDRIDYRPGTTAWGIFDGALSTIHGKIIESLGFDALILATGATDRTMPLPGWTLPGVFTLGGAQALLKSQGCLIGRRVVFCGSSPLLYLAAKQYRAFGAQVAAVLDTTPFPEKVRSLGRLIAAPRTLARGIGYLSALAFEGVATHHGVRVVRIDGDQSVAAIRFRDRWGREVHLDCDAVALGFGLNPETQLADLAGAEFRYDAVFRQWLPLCDSDGRCAPGLYVAGDGATIGGSEVAAISGVLAARALLEDLGLKVLVRDWRGLSRRLRRLRHFQRGLAPAFAWPHNEIAGLPDEVAVCRCEHVSAGELRRSAAADLGPADINRLKALTRCGMGRCQGRFCSLPAAELLAGATGRSVEQVGRLRGQAPVKPLPIAAREARTHACAP